MPSRPTQRSPGPRSRTKPPRRPRNSPGARTLFEISAGGVIYRTTADGVDVCLIATKGGTRWQLPKGRREPGESLEETAVREVGEETGLTGTIGPRLDKINLWFTWNDNGTPVRHHKLVYFFLLTYVRGSTVDHDHEVDDARWFEAQDAMTHLTFPSERKVVARALELIAADQITVDAPAPESARSGA